MTFYSERYDVLNTVELVAALKTPTGAVPTRFRIEILRDETGKYPQPIFVRSYREVHVTLQPTYPRDNDGPTGEPDDFIVWVDHHLPVLPCDSEDFALRRALSFLAEQCAE